MSLRRTKASLEDLSKEIQGIVVKQHAITVEEVRLLIKYMNWYFKKFLLLKGFSLNAIEAVTTKFHDAGRRSPPWKAASSVVPGRPQDGADGNRRRRWLFEAEHKFHATEIEATLVEVKYFLQALSMDGAPALPENAFQNCFSWLVSHPVIPNTYLDPIQLVGIDFHEFLGKPALVQSGHLIPLDRGGRHVPANSFLMLARSNQLQGNLTLDELLALMARIVSKHSQKSPDSF